MINHDLIAIGASGGGIEAFCQIAARLPADLPAAILFVVHIQAAGPRLLHSILQNVGPLPATVAKDSEPVRRGHIYVAPADLHLLVNDSQIQLSRTPRENRARPAVDPLFRSVAHAYGARAIGVVLTGSLDDGAAGLLMIKARGGIAVVQDPADALFPGMPQAALRSIAVDHCVPLEEMAALLVKLTAEEVTEPSPSAQLATSSDAPPDVTGLTRPTCHGGLWERSAGNTAIMECRIGHAFGMQSLLAAQADDLEAALWGAVRALEESAATERRVMTKLSTSLARCHAESAAAKEDQAKLLRRMILGSVADAVLQEEEDIAVQCGGGRARAD